MDESLNGQIVNGSYVFIAPTRPNITSGTPNAMNPTETSIGILMICIVLCAIMFIVYKVIKQKQERLMEMQERAKTDKKKCISRELQRTPSASGSGSNNGSATNKKPNDLYEKAKTRKQGKFSLESSLYYNYSRFNPRLQSSWKTTSVLKKGGRNGCKLPDYKEIVDFDNKNANEILLSLKDDSLALSEKFRHREESVGKAKMCLEALSKLIISAKNGLKRKPRKKYVVAQNAVLLNNSTSPKSKETSSQVLRNRTSTIKWPEFHRDPLTPLQYCADNSYLKKHPEIKAISEDIQTLRLRNRIRCEQDVKNMASVMTSLSSIE